MTAPAEAGPPSAEGQPVSPPLGLFPRHLQLLRLAANGYSIPEIARDLFLSRHTVNDYWREIYRRLGAKNRENAVAIALVRGLIRPDEVELRAPREGYEQKWGGLTPRRPSVNRTS